MGTTFVIIYSLLAFSIGMFILYRHKKSYAQILKDHSEGNHNQFAGKSADNKKTEDLIYLSDEAKVKGIETLITQYPDAMIIAWFRDTLNTYNKVLSKQAVRALDVTPSMIKDKTVIMLERYPLQKKEFIFIDRLMPTKVFFISSLDDTLLKISGGNRLKTMMEKMGSKPNEAISHSLISASLLRVQEEIEKKMLSDPEVNSAEEWFAFNKIEKIG